MSLEENMLILDVTRKLLESAPDVFAPASDRVAAHDLVLLVAENRRLARKVDELQANASKLVMEHQARKEQCEYLSRENSRLLKVVDLTEAVRKEVAHEREGG